jgi:Heterokaryon incompatibility protein (HET)
MLARTKQQFKPPTRLIHVGKFASESVIRLVESRELPSQVLDRRYITLSHCWGAAAGIKLISQRYDDFLRGIDLKALPRTFRDAVTLTRYLGMDYIWIDCLCIIQDSTSDWEIESYQMGDIYQGSFLNIGANAYYNSHGGLFHGRDTNSFMPLRMNLNWPPGHERRQDVAFFPHSGGGQYQINCGPLSTRGWVLQERLLAPRTLHFTRNKVIWECATKTVSETDAAGVIDGTWHLVPRTWTSLPSTIGNRGDKCLDMWRHALFDYTSGDLTYQTDKLVAVLGLANRLQSIWNDTSVRYLAGLWSYKLEIQLLWIILGSGDGDGTSADDGKAEPADDKAPSWSWAAVRGQLVFPDRTQGNEKLLCSIIHGETRPIGHLLGPVQGGLLRIRGPMCTVTVKIGDDDRFGTVKLNELPLQMWDSTFDNLSALNGSEAERSTISLLGVVLSGQGQIYMEGLMLQPTNLQRGQYTRVGKWGVSYDDMNDYNERMVFEILQGNVELANESKRQFDLINEAFDSMTLPHSGFEEEDRVSRVYTITII